MTKNILEIPEKGLSENHIMENLKEELNNEDIDPWSGRSFGLCYLAGKKHTDLVRKAYNEYFVTNGLNPMAFPSLRTMETEVVAMSAWLLNGNRNTTGNMTTGGTESILMAVKAHRDYYRDKKDISDPELILPATAHPAFDKAAHYFDIKTIHIPIREDYRVNVEEMHEKISENTILLVGSAPCYPYGVIDPIGKIASLAKEYNIGCHVDSCLGGFMLPWVEKAGYPLYCEWDFRVDGVTSISADLHKYGYAAKPASVVLFESDKLRKYEFYVYSDWCGGIYGTPNILGTRPGGSFSAAWAALKYQGQEGYITICKEVMKTAKKFIKGINNIDGLHVMGEPDMCVYAYTLDEELNLDFFKLLDLMKQKGNWTINRMQNPPAAHHMTSRVHMPIVETFLDDLAWAFEELQKLPEHKKVKGQAAMYNMMATIDDKEQINDIVTDILLKQYTFDPKKRK